MAVTKTMGYQFMTEEAEGSHYLEDDDLAIILMTAAFAFNPATHSTYADVAADEIAEGYGYIQGDQAGAKLLTSVAVTETANGATVSCDNVTWTASGGSIAEAGSAIVYNKTHENATVICCIDFGADYTTTIGTPLQINFSNGLFTKGNSA